MSLFSCLIKYYNIMFINIVPSMGQWMDYRCRLVRKFIHCFGAQRPLGKIGLSYSLGLWDFIFSCPLYCFPCSCISSYLLFLSYFIRAVPIRKCLGKHSCMSSSFLIVILNLTCFFLTLQLEVHIVYSERKNQKQLCTSKPIPLN